MTAATRRTLSRGRHTTVAYAAQACVASAHDRRVSSQPSSELSKVRILSGDELRLARRLPLDARIAEVAASQHGVISLGQLEACGLRPGAARARVRAGRLHRVHRGVFAPGHPRLLPDGSVAAAVLACGPGAVASHLTGAELLSLQRRQGRTLIDVSAGNLSGRRHGHVVLHSAASLGPQDIIVVDGIPVTSVSRTLLDCAAVVSRRRVEKLCQQAELMQVIDLTSIRGLLAKVRGHPGRGRLRDALAELAGATGTANPGSEEDLLMAFRSEGLPEPECNAPIQRADGSWAFADFLWRAEQLVVEADSSQFHDRTPAYRGDRRRDRALLALDLHTARFSDEDMRDPAACAREVDELLVVRRALRQKRNAG